MKDALAFLLRDLRISQGNCPAGARVALLSYASTPTYLLRFTDMQQKGPLLRLVGDLSYVRSAQRGRLAAAMRFVGRNTFKRVRPALLGRKVAVFLTSGRGQAQEGIGKVALEYVALGIIPVVVTFSSLPGVEQAFQVSRLGQGTRLVPPLYGAIHTLHNSGFFFVISHPPPTHSPPCITETNTLSRDIKDPSTAYCIMKLMDSAYPHLCRGDPV